MREHFWNIGRIGLFYAFAALASGIFVWGSLRLVRRWRSGWRAPRRGPRDAWFADVFLGAGIFRGDPAGGLAHLLALWGFAVLFLGTVLLTVDHYLVSFLRGRTYLVYSLVLDVLGAAFVLALLWLLLRRHLLRRKRLHREEPGDTLLLLLLLAVAVTGFLVEGFRLAATRPPHDDWSPVGALLGPLPADAARSLHRLFWWIHASLALLLVAWFPLGKLRHALVAPVQRALAARTPVLRTAEEREETPEPFGRLELLAADACMWCNRCETVCPSHGAGEALSPRAAVADLRRAAAEGRDRVAASPADVPWLCTSCGACRRACPVGIDARDLIRETRALLVSEGRNVPARIARMLESIAKRGNPWEAPRSKRAEWAADLPVKDLAAGETAAVLWFVGDTPAYDTRGRGIARATARVLAAAGVDFGILGKKEQSSGDLARRCGEDGLFEMMLEANLTRFAEYGVREIIAGSPHDYHALAWEYPRLAALLPDLGGPPPPVRHVTEVLAERIEAGALAPVPGPERRVTYHVPCSLGRHHGITESPRRILRALPGVTLVEMEQNREDALCCGGGGGRMWFEPETPASGGKMSEVRVRQAAAAGAEVLAVACPWCLIQFEDAVKTAGLEGRLRVADVTELLEERLEG